MPLRISTGSGATLATVAIDGAHYQIISPVTLFPSANFIGLVSVTGRVNVAGGSTFVNWDSGATVAIGAMPTVTLNSGVTVNVNNVVNALVSVNNWPSTVAVTQSGTWDEIGINDSGNSITVDGSVGITGLISLASGTFVSLNAGTNAIGKLAANSGVDIGDVDITSIAAGDNNIGNVDIASIAAGDNNIGNVDVVTMPTTNVAQSGTWTVGVNTLISLASGTLVGLNPSSNHIGSVSIFGSITANTGMTTLFPGPNQIGSVTISNTPAVTQSGTWTVQPGNTANSTPWLVTQSGGLISLASGTFVSLNAGTNHIGSVSIFGSVTANTGMTTLFPGPNQIGSVTISNTPAVTQSGTWTVQPGNTANSTPWLVTQTAGLISLASGTLIGLNPSSNHIGSVSIFGNISTTAGMVSLFPGPNQIGSVTVSNIVAVTQSGTWDEVGINDSGNSITIDGNVGVTGLISLASGTFVSLNAGTTNIGDVDILTIAAGDNNIGNVDIASIAAGANYVGLASVNIGGTLPALSAGTAVIGTATVYPVPISTYTSFATIYSASGNATLFVPASSTRWVLKDLLIGSQGAQVVSVKSGTQEIFPPIALASLGGFVMNNGDSGIRGKAVNEAFVLNLGATATLSVLANVRFEA